MLQESHFDKATIFWRRVEIEAVRKKNVHLGGGRLVVDLGCGEGEIAREVFGGNKHRSRIKSGMTLWGLDNNREMVRKARKSGVYKKVLLADARKIPLKDKLVDLVFSNSVLEHIKDVDKVLDEVWRILKPDGKLVFTVPTKCFSEYLGWGRLYAYFFNKKYNHYHLYNLPRWKKILKRHGFEVVGSKYYLSKSEIKYWHGLLWRGRLGLKILPDEKHLPDQMKGAAGLVVAARKEKIR